MASLLGEGRAPGPPAGLAQAPGASPGRGRCNGGPGAPLLALEVSWGTGLRCSCQPSAG